MMPLNDKMNNKQDKIDKVFEMLTLQNSTLIKMQNEMRMLRNQMGTTELQERMGGNLIADMENLDVQNSTEI